MLGLAPRWLGLSRASLPDARPPARAAVPQRQEHSAQTHHAPKTNMSWRRGSTKKGGSEAPGRSSSTRSTSGLLRGRGEDKERGKAKVALAKKPSKRRSLLGFRFRSSKAHSAASHHSVSPRAHVAPWDGRADLGATSTSASTALAPTTTTIGTTTTTTPTTTTTTTTTTTSETLSERERLQQQAAIEAQQAAAAAAEAHAESREVLGGRCLAPGCYCEAHSETGRGPSRRKTPSGGNLAKILHRLGSDDKAMAAALQHHIDNCMCSCGHPLSQHTG